MAYLLWINDKLSFQRHYRDSYFTDKITLIICAKNESQHLKAHLHTWLSLEHIDYTLLLVDDGSTDDTAIFLQGIQHPRLQYMYISAEEKIGKGKKYALQKGIDLANTEWVLLTDADCLPYSPLWAAQMMRKASANEVILGVSPYKHHSSGLLAYLIDYETMLTAIQYGAWASAGVPYMGVGRNMAYKKNLIQHIDAAHYYASASGDDDIFIQHISDKARFTTALELESRTFSYAPKDFNTWIRQKTRHYSTGFQYKFLHQLGLGAFIFTKVGIHSIGIILLLQLSTYALVYAIYLCINSFMLIFINKKIKMPLNNNWLFITDFLMAYLYVFLGIKSRFSKSERWK